MGGDKPLIKIDTYDIRFALQSGTVLDPQGVDLGTLVKNVQDAMSNLNECMYDLSRVRLVMTTERAPE